MTDIEKKQHGINVKSELKYYILIKIFEIVT